MSANDVGVGTSNHNEHGMKTLRPITCGKFLVPPAPRTAVSASNCNQQPETINAVWNLRGILNNSWHTVPVTLSD